MLRSERIVALHRELIELANQPDAPTVLREDTSVLLDTLGRFLPPVDAIAVATAEQGVEQGGEQATQVAPAKRRRKGSKTWMSGEVPPAAEGGGQAAVPTTQAPPPPPVGSHKQLDVDVQQGPAGVDVTPRSPGQEDAARTVRELLNGLVGRKLTPLGEVAHDLTLAVERRDMELQAFLGTVFGGKALLEVAVDFTTPQGAAVADWFNALVRWFPVRA